MFKFLSGLLASIASIFVSDADKLPPPPLNAAIIAYQETYFAPVVADLGNFPRAKSLVVVDNKRQEKETKTTPTIAPPPAIAPTPALPPQDLYLATPEPIVSWLSMNLTMVGDSNDPNNPRVLPEITFDREYWKVEVFAYWAPTIVPPKPDMQNDYFKLEVYEKGTDKLIYTMTSGNSDASHKFQAFRKPGIYYFKVYTKNPSTWELTFVVSPKLAQ